MIKLQVNHKHHEHMRSVIVQKEKTLTKQTEQDKSIKVNTECNTTKQSIDKHQNIQQTDRQISTLVSIQATQQKVKRDLQEMIEQYKNQAEKIIINHGYDPEKEAEIRRHLRKLKKQKEERRVKFENDLKHLEEKKIAVDRSDSSDQNKKMQKRASIEKRIEKIKERQRKRQEQENVFQQFYHQYKKSKPLHQKLQEEFTKKVETEKQQKMAKLKQKVQQVYKPMDLQALSQFEQNYMKNKYEADKWRLRNQLMEKKKIQANRQKLNELYKGHCHSLVLEELAEKNNKVNQSYQKNKRIRQYSQIVKEEYKPRTMKSSLDTQEDQTGDSIPQTERGRRVVKDRYIKGQYQGKIVTYQKVPLSHSEQVSKGIQYLQFLKSIPKKPKKKVETSTIIPQIKKQKTSVYRIQKLQNPLYDRSRRYSSIDCNLKQGDSESVRRVMQFMRYRKQQLNLDEKLLRNLNPRDRSQWQANQKQFNTELVGSIQQKLQILKRM